MTSAARQRRSLRSLYPPEHAKHVAEAEARDPHYLDDTLDAIGPGLLMGELGSSPPTPEQIAAAHAKAVEGGWLPRTGAAHGDHREPRTNGAGAAEAARMANTIDVPAAPVKKVAKKR